MAMNRIDRPPLVQPKVLEQFKKSTGQREVGSDRLGRETTQAIQKEQVKDRVEISESARKLNHMRQALVAGRKALDRVPDQRQQRLDQARARLQTGYYNSEEVRQEVAAKLRTVIKMLDTL